MKARSTVLQRRCATRRPNRADETRRNYQKVISRHNLHVHGKQCRNGGKMKP